MIMNTLPVTADQEAASPSRLETASLEVTPVTAGARPKSRAGQRAGPGASAHGGYNCRFCGKFFNSRSNMVVHERTHTHERPYTCSFCGRTFSQHGQMVIHVRSHTGQRPFKCAHCTKAFTSSKVLKIHIRTHTGEKPYGCEHCAKRFAAYANLVVHRRIHTKVRPYKCHHCGRTFEHSGNLQRHTKVHKRQLDAMAVALSAASVASVASVAHAEADMPRGSITRGVVGSARQSPMVPEVAADEGKAALVSLRCRLCHITYGSTTDLLDHRCPQLSECLAGRAPHPPAHTEIAGEARLPSSFLELYDYVQQLREQADQQRCALHQDPYIQVHMQQQQQDHEHHRDQQWQQRQQQQQQPSISQQVEHHDQLPPIYYHHHHRKQQQQQQPAFDHLHHRSDPQDHPPARERRHLANRPASLPPAHHQPSKDTSRAASSVPSEAELQADSLRAGFRSEESYRLVLSSRASISVKSGPVLPEHIAVVGWSASTVPGAVSSDVTIPRVACYDASSGDSHGVGRAGADHTAGAPPPPASRTEKAGVPKFTWMTSYLAEEVRSAGSPRPAPARAGCRHRGPTPVPPPPPQPLRPEAIRLRPLARLPLLLEPLSPATSQSCQLRPAPCTARQRGHQVAAGRADGGRCEPPRGERRSSSPANSEHSEPRLVIDEDGSPRPRAMTRRAVPALVPIDQYGRYRAALAPLHGR